MFPIGQNPVKANQTPINAKGHDAGEQMLTEHARTKNKADFMGEALNFGWNNQQAQRVYHKVNGGTPDKTSQELAKFRQDISSVTAPKRVKHESKNTQEAGPNNFSKRLSIQA